MKRAGRTLGRAAFAAAVAAALGFGAWEVAAPRPAAASPLCTSNSTCQAYCDKAYPGQGRFGICRADRTCACVF